MNQRPVTYRAEIIGPLLNSIAAGECCSIVGISGVGKSNMVQHMLQPDILRHYIGDQADTLRFVMLDTNMFAEQSPWGFFEGLTEALIASTSADLPQEQLARLRSAHQEILHATGGYALALRRCTEVLDILCTQQRLVIMFDEFDPLFEQLTEAVLRNLRGLRDRYKYRLMYLTFSRQPLIKLRDADDWDAIEPFVELLSLRELGLHPLSDDDAAAEVRRFAARHNQTVTASTQTSIVGLSGGHPALLRALTQAALPDEQHIAIPIEELCQRPTLRLECAKIWQQLTGDERDGLLAVARGRTSDQNHTQTFMLKGLLRARPNGASSVFSPLFAAYLKAIGAPQQGPTVPITIDLKAGRVIYYGRDISRAFGPKERDLLFFLWKHYGEICSFTEVAQEVYRDELPVYLDQNSEFERLRTLAGRVRRKLEHAVPDQPELLATYKGLGYCLGIPAVTP